MSATSSPADYVTLPAWGRACRPALSASALKTRCRTAGVRPSQAKDFSRLLRTLSLAVRGGWHPTEFLDIIDSRSLRRLLARGDVGFLLEHDCLIDEFCRRQHFLVQPKVIEAVLGKLDLHRGTPE